MMLLLLLATAHAAPFGQARLVDGWPDDASFQSCVSGGGSCADHFYGFLTGGMLEQGFAMQDHALLTNPLVNRRDGGLAGGALTTFPFGPPPSNLSGKQENTSFSPVFPKLRGGVLGGEGTRHGLGLSLTPPVPVGGAAALALGVDGGLAFGPADASAWGVHGDLSFVRARAPVTATEEQMDDRESFSNPDNLDPDQYAEVCGDEGCKDTFTQAALAIRGGRGWVAGAWTPWAQVGLSAIYANLHVMYDDTTWRVLTLQPTVHAGTGWAPGEHLQLALGASAAPQLTSQRREDTGLGVFWRLEGAAGWVF